MKPLIWLMLFTGCMPLQASSQEPDPIYGLGVCTSGTYHINQEVASSSGPGDAPCVPAANDSSRHRFLTRFEEGCTSFVNGDPREGLQHVSRGEDVTILDGWGAYEQDLQQAGPDAAIGYQVHGVQQCRKQDVPHAEHGDGPPVRLTRPPASTVPASGRAVNQIP
jgi:hypothetical protein